MIFPKDITRASLETDAHKHWSYLYWEDHVTIIVTLVARGEMNAGEAIERLGDMIREKSLYNGEAGS